MKLYAHNLNSTRRVKIIIYQGDNGLAVITRITPSPHVWECPSLTAEQWLNIQRPSSQRSYTIIKPRRIRNATKQQ